MSDSNVSVDSDSDVEVSREVRPSFTYQELSGRSTASRQAPRAAQQQQNPAAATSRRQPQHTHRPGGANGQSSRARQASQYKPGEGRGPPQHGLEMSRGADTDRNQYVVQNSKHQFRLDQPQVRERKPKRAQEGEHRRQHQPESRRLIDNKSRGHPQSARLDRSSVPEKIQEWLQQSVATRLVFDISAATEELSMYLKTTPVVPADTISGLASLLHRVVSTNQKGPVDRIMRCVLDAYFIDGHFILFLDQQVKSRALRPDTLRSLHQVLNVVEYAIQNTPEHRAKCNYSLQQIAHKGQQLDLMASDNRLMLQAQKLINQSQASQFQEDQKPFQYQHVIVNQEERSSTQTRRRALIEPDHDEALPLDDYRTISIFPETEELFDGIAPFLRANKTSGAYRDLQHYLDIHSRLLKEDYLEPIRHGLKDFMLAKENESKVKEDNLRFYHDVKLIKMKCDESRGITHIVQFSQDNLANIDWEHSRRLLYGSLLVLSKNMFETTAFATVSDHNPKMLENGFVEIIFENNLDEIFTSSEFDVFVMAETTAYFESYRHVLEGLQEMEQLPLSRYILSCEKNIYPPAYYLESPEVDISCIASEGRCLAPVEILEEDDWPDADSTIVNESQMEAMKLALTKEMAIIQGPPGTGKTYVGLKIMNILLKHITKERRDKRSPILVVCYTNHALDQFLEGMLSFCNTGIVRVGGRSSSELLKDFNLKELRKNPKMERHVRREVTRYLKKCKENLKTVAKYIETYWQQSLKQETTILSVGDLHEEMATSHQQSLQDPQRQSDLNPHVVRVWLRATNANMENHMTKAAIRRLAEVIASGDDGRPDSNITSTLGAARADFIARVQIYRYWAGRYRVRLESELDQLTFTQTEGEARVQKLLDEQEALNTDILPDGKLIPLMENKDIYEYIKECVEAESKDFDSSKQTVVRQWLLGFTAVDYVLDAIEKLTKKEALGTKHGKKPKSREVDTEDGFDSSAVRRKQWVLDDSSGEDEDDEENDDNDENSDLENGSEADDMEDIDDFHGHKKKTQRAEFRDITRDFEQFQNREIQIYQRALMLGVNMAVTELEDQEDEWQEGDALSHSKVFRLLHSVQPFDEEKVASIRDVWSLELSDRYRLYKYWVQLRKEKLTARLIDLTEEYRRTLAEKKKTLNEKDVAILRTARVIGMTTSGAARHRSVLQRVGSQIVVVEEAAEVLEAHTITALNAKVKHLILIGDHQQLRPNPTVYRLATDYNLEISLFERLVRNGVPCVMLKEQHRMRPEIAQFVRHIYPELRDHGTVNYYGNIEGVASNVFFLQHNFEESEVDDSSSKANTHEAKFVTALCKYFLQHRYEGSQISVLAAYGGQVAAIKEAMEPEESMYEGVRVTSIDNYQGEENDIILLSLVRSNKDNRVGFLKTDNRVCVALSRAKKGLFVIGNLNQIAFKSLLWKKILATATQKRVTGVAMKLVCVNHKEHATYVSSQEDFQRNVPEGGCSQPCGAVLPCGHVCNLTCHSWDRFHQETPCRQPCLRSCPEGHPCPLTCSDECGPCQVLVKRTLQDCNHEDTVPCYEDVKNHVCKQPCKKMLPCGHECRGTCGECSSKGIHAPCLEKVEKTWPTCEHKNTTECHTDPTVEPCTTKCKATLNCGHKCKGTCGGCLGGRVHRPCQSKCNKPLPCGHPCAGPCGGVCMPCPKRCPTRCRHGPCSRTTCGALCQPCLENCSLTCSHSTCSRRCLDECVSKPCVKVCGMPVAKCKHKCVSLCGERCVCSQCDKGMFQLLDTSNARKKQPQLVVAHEKRERAKKFELTPDVVLMKIPACGHVFTLNQLDKYVSSLPSDDSSYIPCPSVSCPAVLQGIRRYEDINKQRAELRHARKGKLIEDVKVSFPELSQLRFSLAKIQRYCDIDKAKYLHSNNIEQNIDPNEVMAFRSNIRFVYALHKIEQIDNRFNKERVFKSLKWMRLILDAKRTITPQFREEMRLELHRLLLSQQLLILHNLIKSSYTQTDGSFKTAISTVRNACKEKVAQRDLKTLQATIEQFFQKLLNRPENDYWRTLAATLKSRSLHICTCLDAPEDQDLCIILEQSPDESSSSSEDEDDSSSEDEGSSELSFEGEQSYDDDDDDDDD